MFLVVIVLMLSLNSIANAKSPFYVIAHMTNTPNAVDWAMTKGANALEMDLRFESDGTPDIFHHGGICECNICILTDNSVCSALHYNCGAQVGVKTMFNHLATKSSLALVLIDSKMDAAISSDVQTIAGANIIQFMDAELFKKGYQGKVIVSVPHPDVLQYLKSAAKQAKISPYGSRVYFSIDQEGGKVTNAACTIKTLTNIDSKNIVYGTGITACISENFKPAIDTGVTNRNRRVLDFVYIWTLDKQSSMSSYIDKGVNGIMTNYPQTLLKVVKEKGLTLATPNSPILASANSNVFGSESCDCDCDYHPGGCVISKPAPSGTACKCKYMGAWTCRGSITTCSNINSEYCAQPDTSISSCTLGGGDCDGYKNQKCDCNYERGGCYISEPAPKNTACKCKYLGAWRCAGSVVRCSNEKSWYCELPDDSKASCRQGGGDCDAKRYKGRPDL